MQISNHTVYNYDTGKCANQFNYTSYNLKYWIFLQKQAVIQAKSGQCQLREFEEDHDMIDQSAGINDYGYEFLFGKIKNKYHRKSFQKEQRLYNGQFSLPTE